MWDNLRRGENHRWRCHGQGKSSSAFDSRIASPRVARRRLLSSVEESLRVGALSWREVGYRSVPLEISNLCRCGSASSGKLPLSRNVFEVRFYSDLPTIVRQRESSRFLRDEIRRRRDGTPEGGHLKYAQGRESLIYLLRTSFGGRFVVAMERKVRSSIVKQRKVAWNSVRWRRVA